MKDSDRPLLSRREFLRATLVTGGAVISGVGALEVFARDPHEVETRFVVLSDTHIGSNGDAARLEHAVPRIRREDAAFLLHTGDVVEDLVTDAAQVETARGLLAQLPGPLHLVPGNHDVGLRDSLEMRKAWGSVFGPTEQVVRYGEWNFVGFDSLALSGACRCGELESQVLGFLEEELPKLDGRRTILIYHVPEVRLPRLSSVVWSETALERWQDLTNRLRPAAALAGHWHLGVRVPGASYPLVVAPPISGRGNLPTGYLRCSIKGDSLLCERVMIETANKRDLPVPVKWLLLPEAQAEG